MPLCGAPPDFVGKTRGATPVSVLKQNEGMTITYLLLNRQGLLNTYHTDRPLRPTLYGANTGTTAAFTLLIMNVRLINMVSSSIDTLTLFTMFIFSDVIPEWPHNNCPSSLSRINSVWLCTSWVLWSSWMYDQCGVMTEGLPVLSLYGFAHTSWFRQRAECHRFNTSFEVIRKMLTQQNRCPSEVFHEGSGWIRP